MIAVTAAHAASRANATARTGNDVEHPEMMLPLPEHRLFSYSVEMPGLREGNWESRAMHVTTDMICFGKLGSNTQLDYIPLKEVAGVQLSDHHNKNIVKGLKRSLSRSLTMSESTATSNGIHSPLQSSTDSATAQGSLRSLGGKVNDLEKTKRVTCTIRTIRGGHNAGKAYSIRCNSVQHAQDMIKQLENLVAEALTDPSDTCATRMRRQIQAMYESDAAQMVVALLIVGAFVNSIVSAEIIPDLVGEDLANAVWLEHKIELTFTILFSIELLANMISHWFWDFFRSAWNMFDMLIVFICWAAEMSHAIPNVATLRLLRVFRVIRLFQGFAALRIIISALSKSIVPVMNAVSLFLMTIAIYAVIAVGLFKDANPNFFGRFSSAAFTMFQIATGDAWASEVTRYLWQGEDGEGELHVGIALFFVSFVLIVGIVLMNVVIACLLDRFISTMAEEKEEKERQTREEKMALHGKVSGPLDPLLKRLLTYSSLEDLDRQLLAIVNVIDEDGDGDLTCSEINMGLRQLDFDPPIYLSIENFELLSAGLSSDGKMDGKAFAKMILRELQSFMRLQIVHSIEHADAKSLGTLCGLKLLTTPPDMDRDLGMPENTQVEKEKRERQQLVAKEIQEGELRSRILESSAENNGLNTVIQADLVSKVSVMESNIDEVKSRIESVEGKIDLMLAIFKETRGHSLDAIKIARVHCHEEQNPAMFPGSALSSSGQSGVLLRAPCEQRDTHGHDVTHLDHAEHRIENSEPSNRSLFNTRSAATRCWHGKPHPISSGAGFGNITWERADSKNIERNTVRALTQSRLNSGERADGTVSTLPDDESQEDDVITLDLQVHC